MLARLTFKKRERERVNRANIYRAGNLVRCEYRWVRDLSGPPSFSRTSAVDIGTASLARLEYTWTCKCSTSAVTVIGLEPV